MNESTDTTSVMQTYLRQALTRELLDWERAIIERDKPFTLPPNEEREVESINAEILSRVGLQTVGTSPHLRWQLVAVAIITVALLAIGFIPELGYIHALLSMIVPAWALLHWPYLYPQRYAAH